MIENKCFFLLALLKVFLIIFLSCFSIIKANNIGLGLKECDSFANICTMNVVDQSILVTSSTSNNYITIPIEGEYYISFNVSLFLIDNNIFYIPY